MKNLMLFFSLLISVSVFTQNKADDIIGFYQNTDPFNGEKSQVYIFKTTQGTYAGKITWVENPIRKQFIDQVFLTDLQFDDKKNEWVDGKITYPNKKGVYRAYFKFENKNTLKVRGYLGVSLFGKTLYWQKETQKRIKN